MLHHYVLDFVGENLEAGDVDHVLLAIEDFEKAFVVERADIAGVQPAVLGENQFALFVAMPIAVHHLRTAHANLAGFADRQVVAVLVADGDFS